MNRPSKKVTVAAPLLWFALIWVLSSMPSDKLPSVKILSFDKVLHIAVYFVLAALTNIALRTHKAKPHIVFLVYAVLFLSAALDEYHQSWIPNRSVTFWDYLANSVGLALGQMSMIFTHDKSRRT